jgi:F420-dependent oxidoreductase-like protein
MTLRVGVGLSRDGRDDWESAATFAREAERLGVASMWASETWGFDGATPLAYIAAHTEHIRLGTSIIQVGARTPAMTAMTAMSLASITGDRFVLGIGTATAQIMEAWHGVSFDRPVQRTRELIEIVRLISARERVIYDGEIQQLPLTAEARPMRSTAAARHIPIHIASIGPRNLRMTGELADGWIGNSFIPETADVFFDPLRAGAEGVGRNFDDIEKQVPVTLEFDDDLDALAKRHAIGFAFTFGAMGTPGRNFYVQAFSRQGFADEVHAVHRLWLDGKREEAEDLVPIEIALKTNLLGTEETVKDRLRAYRDAGIDELRVGLRGENIDERLQNLGRLMQLVDEVNTEPR